VLWSKVEYVKAWIYEERKLQAWLEERREQWDMKGIILEADQ
jgi:hypothetical protein